MIVDNHPMTRSGLAHLIKNQRDLTVCGEAESAREAMRVIAEAKADLVVLEISLGDKSGLELIKDFHALYPGLHVLVMSLHDESIYAERALRAGARGYIMKKHGGDAVLDAIRKTVAGKIYLSGPMSERLGGLFAESGSANQKTPLENLTAREFEVFKLIGEGLITREIARRMFISHKTVDVYRQRLKEKLDLPNSTSLIQQAVLWIEAQNRV